MINVLLVDDHEMVRMGLSAFLSTQIDMNVVGQASDGEQGLKLALEKKAYCHSNGFSDGKNGRCGSNCSDNEEAARRENYCFNKLYR